MKYNPIILALDYSDVSEAREMLSKVRSNIGMIKIGLELYSAAGKESLELSKEFNVPVFLDLKLHDVPTTVEKTVGNLCQKLSQYHGEHFLSVHCYGGKEMCARAAKVAEGSNIHIVGITTLTSMAERDFGAMGFRDCRPGIRTVDAAYIGADCFHERSIWDSTGKTRILSGLKHFVCAPNQLNLMRQHLGPDAVLISPGIRSDAEEVNDHKRCKPASFALKSGVNWLVIGRPITQSPNPEYTSLHFKEQADKFQ
jgi:orotidine-5'-phosphate decarboxylase